MRSSSCPFGIRSRPRLFKRIRFRHDTASLGGKRSLSPDSSNAHARVDYTVEVAALLIDAGARTDVPDSQGLVPRDYFERYLEGLVEEGRFLAEEQSEALNRGFLCDEWCVRAHQSLSARVS